jgi:transcriptional regulator with PAS, ATPase and Fis domain
MKTLCVVTHSPSVALKLKTDLEKMFGQFIRIITWCMDEEENPPSEFVDMYLASFQSVYDEAQLRFKRLPRKTQTGRLVLARRVLSPVHFNKLLALQPGTRVIIAANSFLACDFLLKSINDFGMHHLDVTLHYPNKPVDKSEGIHIALVTGVNKAIPDWVDTVIDIGVKELAFTTYSQIIHEMDMPPELLDDISMNYTLPIFGVTKKYYEEGKKVHAILQCVEDAVFTIDADGFIDIRNRAAVRMHGYGAPEERTHISAVFPKLDMPFPLRPDFVLHDIITECDGQHYILKLEPVQGDALGAVVLARQVSRVQELEGMVRQELKRSGNTARYSFQDIVTRSPEMKKTVELARLIAGTKLTVLLEGESGVGKELFAHAIHSASDRASGPFVAINLAAMPESLAESELFGYVEGSFTGARKGGKRGLFEEAHQGTIFLDEVGDAPLPLQTKLLRVLEEREIRKVGGKTGIPVDVRVVAATNRPLASMISENTFRADLFYRLCACPLSIPPLRERRQDILLLAAFYAESMMGEALRLNRDVQCFFEAYTWPGNVRELQNVISYLVSVVGKGRTITIEHLPQYLVRRPQPGQSKRPDEGSSARLERPAGSGCEPAGNVIEKNLSGTSSLPPSAPAASPSPLSSTDRPPRTEQAAFPLCLKQYAVRGMLKHVDAILDVLEGHAQCGLSTGRNALLHELGGRGLNVSMHALRTCLKMLLDQRLISVGVTRQGCRITSQGTAFLHWMRQERQVRLQFPERIPKGDGALLERQPGRADFLEPLGT